MVFIHSLILSPPPPPSPLSPSPPNSHPLPAFLRKVMMPFVKLGGKRGKEKQEEKTNFGSGRFAARTANLR